MSLSRLLAASFLAFAATAATAQPETSLAIPARHQIDAVLRLDAPRARQVDAILEAAYARMTFVRTQMASPSTDGARLALLTAVLTIRYETDTQLASVLSPDEFARLKESMYAPRWERALPSRGTAM